MALETLAQVSAALTLVFAPDLQRQMNRLPDRYGRHDRTRVEGKVDVDAKVEVSADEQLVSKLAGLIERARKTRDSGEPERG